MKKEKHNLMLRINEDLYQEIKKESERLGISVHETIIICLLEKFER